MIWPAWYWARKHLDTVHSAILNRIRQMCRSVAYNIVLHDPMFELLLVDKKRRESLLDQEQEGVQ